jgi:predicted regulator of amino acid metabolism with ACT domain
MWSEILAKFEKYPAQEKVTKVLLDHGFQVDENGQIISGIIKIPHRQIAKEAKVDWRAVDQTTQTILKDDLLRSFFSNLKSFVFLRDVAPLLGLGVIIITPVDASRVGIIEEVTQAIAGCGIRIRQAVCDDPYFIDDPKLTIICDTKVSSELIDIILKLQSIKSITIY